MIQLVATTLTMTSVLLHAVLGCCWHHGHGGPHGVASVCSHQVPAESGDASHDHESHDHAAHETPEDNGQPAPAGDPCNDDEPCDESRCSYVASGKVELGEPDVGIVTLLPLSPVRGMLVGAFATGGTRPHWISVASGCDAARFVTQAWLL